jgi:hypothetical protein
MSLFLFFCLSSCLGPKKIDKWVAQHYGEVPPVSKKKNEMIVVTSSLPTMGVRLSTTEKRTSNLLPLIFYWQYDYKNTCSLNPQIGINNFTSTVMSYGNKGLKQTLNGQRIELNVEKIPTTFAVDDKGHIIWVIYAFGWDVLTVKPEDADFVVSYKVFGAGDVEVRSGAIKITNSTKGSTLGMFQSLKKKTLQYLDQYDASVTSMSKVMIDKLNLELKGPPASTVSLNSPDRNN